MTDFSTRKPIQRRVLKWDVPVDGQVHQIGGGRVVHIASQFGLTQEVQVWTEEYYGDEPRPVGYVKGLFNSGPAEPRFVEVYGTGHVYEGNALGSAIVGNEHLVWHVVEVDKPA